MALWYPCCRPLVYNCTVCGYGSPLHGPAGWEYRVKASFAAFGGEQCDCSGTGGDWTLESTPPNRCTFGRELVVCDLWSSGTYKTQARIYATAQPAGSRGNWHWRLTLGFKIVWLKQVGGIWFGDYVLVTHVWRYESDRFTGPYCLDPFWTGSDWSGVLNLPLAESWVNPQQYPQRACDPESRPDSVKLALVLPSP